jgi:hydrogenase maturation protease
MNRPADTLVVGIGSDLGDDRLGPYVAQQLAAQRPDYPVLALRAPVDLLDHLEGIAHLHVVDACRGGGSPGTILRHDWPAAELEHVHFAGTHDFSIVAVLQLAERLQRLPAQVTIWSIEMADTQNSPAWLASLSPPVAAAAEVLLARLTAEVALASRASQDSDCHA